MKFIRWFHEIQSADVDLVGGKGANLGEMTQAELPVPPGFCLTAGAYRQFIDHHELEHAIRMILDGIDLQDADDLEASCGFIRDLINENPIPEAMQLEILESYRLLGQQLGLQERAAFPVAVRSSATAEDLPTASFAGQQDTYLNVCGEESLLANVKSCWASLWTTRAVTYRTRQGFDHHKVYLAVVVQAMIPSEVAGIMFTANPVDGDLEVAVVNASWGLGEAIVSGLVTPDTLMVHKRRGEILSRLIASKDCCMRYATQGGVEKLETPAEQRLMPALTDSQALELVSIGSRIEAHYGTPQDIEWAYAQGHWYILQVRPVTTLAGEAELPSHEPEYNRTMFVDIFPDPLSPVFSSIVETLFQSMLDFTFCTWGFEPPKGMQAIRFFYNQPYFNRGYIETAVSPLSPTVRDLLVAQMVNPFGDHKARTQVEFSRAYLRMMINTLRFMTTFPKQLPDMLSKYHAEVAQVEALQIEALPDAELVAVIKEMVYGSTRTLLDHDYLLIAVIKRVYHFLGMLLEPYFGEEAEVVRGKLISGVTGNVTMETNIHLWDLAQLAKASPGVSRLLRRYTGKELFACLKEIPDGRAFLEELDRFLEAFGHREVRMDIVYPTWCEDPSPVFNFIRGYLDVGEDKDPHLQQERLYQQRKELTEVVHARLAQESKGRYLIWPLFHWLLDNIEFHTRERDTMHFELTRIFPAFRRYLLELGRRWMDVGVLSQPEQIFFLTFDEIEGMAKQPEPVHQLAARRQEEYETNKHRPWPNVIRGGREEYAQEVELSLDEEGRLQGVAGSPGVVTGRACVIRGPEEFHRLQKGDILIAPITNPVWTPLFAIASAVVTEVGGILSHGAIVAREYGIPAVMSITSATQRILEGQTITVDGDKGRVYIAMGAA
jgi:rifampicin phosphotransferase